MNPAPFFSVVMPVYNRANIVAESIESILAQTFTDYEIIVVDDGSTDDTVSVIQKYSNIRILKQENSGPGEARNLAARHATGRYLAFLDSDDLWFPWSLETYAAVIAENDSPSFIAGKHFVFKDACKIEQAVETKVSINRFEDYLDSGDEWRWFGVSSFVVRRQEFSNVGGFTSGRINAEDAELALRLGTSPGFVQITSPPTFGYRSHTGNITFDPIKSNQGLQAILSAEANGNLPGGNERRAERWRILSRHIRPHVVAAAKKGRVGTALKLYSATLSWHLKSMRLKFLLAVPVMAFVGGVKRIFGIAGD